MTVTKLFQINEANIEAGNTALAAEEGKLKQAEAKTIIKEKNLLEKKNELVKKGADALDFLSTNVAKPIAKMIPPLMIGAGAKMGYDQYEKYREEGFNPLQSVGKSAYDVAAEFSPLGTGKAIADVLTTEAGDSTISGTNQQDINLSNKVYEQSQNNFLNNTSENNNNETAQVANIMQEDANVGSKMGTFGRPSNVEAGFVTPPNRSELNVETERQLNQNSFLGAT